jgi:hypothetical protein
MLEARSRSFMIGAVLASNHRNDLSSLDTLLASVALNYPAAGMEGCQKGGYGGT